MVSGWYSLSSKTLFDDTFYHKDFKEGCKLYSLLCQGMLESYEYHKMKYGFQANIGQYLYRCSVRHNLSIFDVVLNFTEILVNDI